MNVDGIIHNSQKWKQMYTDKWINKTGHVNIINRLSDHKKEVPTHVQHGGTLETR